MSRAKLAKTPVIGASTPTLIGPAGACAAAVVLSIARTDTPTTAMIERRMGFSSGGPQRGQDVPGELRDVLLCEPVRQAAELEETHEDAGSQLAHLRLELARDVVGIADDGQPLLLHQLEVHLVEGQILGAPDLGGARRGRLAHELHRAAVIGEELL